MHHCVAECFGFLVADAEREGADGAAGFALLFFSEQGPGERNRTFGIVIESFVTDRAVVN